jgi:hypothetical protein
MAESVKNDHAIIIEINDVRRRLDRTSAPPTMMYDHCSHSAPPQIHGMSNFLTPAGLKAFLAAARAALPGCPDL